MAKPRENSRRSIFSNWSFSRISPFSRRKVQTLQPEQENHKNNVSILTKELQIDNKQMISLNHDKVSPRKTYKYSISGDSVAVENIYTELLYTISHPIGSEVNQTHLLLYVQDVFGMNTERHEELLEVARKKENPQLLLNIKVKIVNDRQLPEYDCSNVKLRVKLLSISNIEQTWPIQGPDQKHVIFSFFVRILNHDQFDMLELTLWEDATSTKLFGKAVIPYKKLHSSSSVTWFKITTTKEYVIQVGITLNYKEPEDTSFDYHKYLRKKLLQHDLSLSEIVPYWWCQMTHSDAEQILQEHAVQNGLSQTSVDLCSFLAYAEVHHTTPLNFTVFSRLIQNLVEPIQNQDLTDEELEMFWKAMQSLVPSLFSIIKTSRVTVWSQNMIIKQFSEVLKILKVIKELLLYRTNIKFIDDQKMCDLTETLSSTTTEEADKWLAFPLEKAEENSTELTQLKNLIHVCQVIQDDLDKTVKYYNNLFIEYMEFHYAKHLYIFYEKKISKLLESKIKQISKNFKKIHYLGCNTKQRVTDMSEVSSDDPLSGGRLLFCLYMKIQKFVELGRELFEDDFQFYIGNFHQWFHGAVSQWLDAESFTASARINKKLQQDTLLPCANSVRYSSSALDCLVTFYQTKFMWERLKWPDLESSCNFVLKFIEVISTLHQLLLENSSTIELTTYITDNVLTLDRCLNRNHFEKVLRCTRQALIKHFNETAEDNLGKNKPLTYYTFLEDAFTNVSNLLLRTRVEFFDDDSLKKTLTLLNTFRLGTPELIHQINLKTCEYYSTTTKLSIGELWLKCKFSKDSLIIKVLNANIDSSIKDNLNSFIIISLLPSHKLLGVSNFRTKTKTNSFSPTFDDNFKIKLKPEQSNIDGLVLFSIRHREYLKIYRVGEAMIKFDKIPRLSTKLPDVSPTKIRIFKPTNVDPDAIRALESRTTDNKAKDFLKDFKLRIM
ncbi:protein unc-13 homolog 4B-like isoform X5 [Rhynchophorus ferrugineus]|uniref:protein unc-13 homolog 4B-like isoform X5 n=1 Tax=Rhynchophorus ferrugineus TaxID=354439 RepID=UPI003FCC9FAF